MTTKFSISFLFALIIFVPSFLFAQNYDPCLLVRDFKIVVIGSSTAAGTGVSTSDSAWVNRYRKHLKSVNPQNEVINLALGGHHTYALMPSEFVPPTDRPFPDTLRNITRAIALSPDAIIINLPSNDNSKGYLMQEQLDNFDSIVNNSNSAGIPIYVCTTQPKNYSVQEKMDTQRIVRDSIFRRYGDFALDFWSEIGDSIGRIKSEYDSGDGTHLNDAAHRILNNRVVEKNIPLTLLETQSSVDYGIVEIIETESHHCEGTPVELGIVFANFGAQDSSGISTSLHFEHCLDNALTGLGNIHLFSDSICSLDTFFSNFTAYSTDCAFVAQFNHPSGYVTDDKLKIDLKLNESPEIIARDTSACGPNEFDLKTFVINSDSTVWYNSSDTNFSVGMGTSFLTPLLDSSTTYLIQAFKKIEDFGELVTTHETNRDWNGVMIDMYAKEKIRIDSIYMRFSTPGNQIIQISTKLGSILGSEQDSSAWTFFYQDSIFVDSASIFQWIPIPSIILNRGDTLGFYFEMENANSRLAYFAEASNQVFENKELIVTHGTGISKGFSATYYPRSFLGSFQYQILYDTLAFCQSSQELNIVISEPKIDLGPDLIIGLTDTIRLAVVGDFESYTWSDGSTNSSLLIFANEFNNGEQEFFLTVIDQWDCVASDTILIRAETVKNIDLGDEVSHTEYGLHPNPVIHGFNLKSNDDRAKVVDLRIFNQLGQLIISEQISLPGYVDCSTLFANVYRVEIRNREGTRMRTFLKLN